MDRINQHLTPTESAGSGGPNDSAGELLTDVLSHVDFLSELREKTLTRDELAQRLDVSTSTSYRYTNELVEWDVVSESGEEVMLTSLGETIADEVSAFETTVAKSVQSDDDSQDVLVELLRLSPGLQAVSRRPLDRRELEDRLGVSDTTGYRITRSLEDRALIEKANGRYEITETGEEILEAVSTFELNVRTAVHLGPVLRALREEGPSVDVDAFTGATVTTTSGYTFSPQTRFLDILVEAETIRGFMVEAIVPSILGDIRHRSEPKLVEHIKPSETVAEMLSEFPDRAMKLCNQDMVSVYVHDELWYGLAILDERICLGVLDTESGACQALIDTDAPAAREWAEAVYESYKAEAVYLPSFDPFTLRDVLEEVPGVSGPPAGRR